MLALDLADLCPSTLATHLPTTAMDSTAMYKCPCYRCTSVKRPFTRRTIQEHHKKSSDYLIQLRASGGHQDLVNYVQGCHENTAELLSSTEDSQSSSRSPYPEGEQLLRSFNHLTDMY